MATLTKRKSVRFKPDLNTLAVIAFPLNRSKTFIGLVINESNSGCRVAVIKDFPLKKGDFCDIAVGKLSPMPAELIWRIDVGDSLSELGFRYVE